MAAVTKNRNFFNCPLLLYYKSKWTQILTAAWATWQWVQQWTIEEISIFSNSNHLEWRAGLSDTILKRNHPGTIPARFGLIWFSGFRRSHLNLLLWNRWTKFVSGGPALWPRWLHSCS
jgi:hypothetical protein